MRVAGTHQTSMAVAILGILIIPCQVPLQMELETKGEILDRPVCLGFIFIWSIWLRFAFVPCVWLCFIIVWSIWLRFAFVPCVWICFFIVWFIWLRFVFVPCVWFTWFWFVQQLPAIQIELLGLHVLHNYLLKEHWLKVKWEFLKVIEVRWPHQKDGDDNEHGSPLSRWNWQNLVPQTPSSRRKPSELHQLFSYWICWFNCPINHRKMWGPDCQKESKPCSSCIAISHFQVPQVSVWVGQVYI